MQKIGAYIISTLTGVAFFLYGSNPVHLQWLIILLVLVASDLLFGVINKLMDHEFSRRLLLEGVRRKFGELFTIAIAHLLDTMNIFQGAISLQQAATGFLIAYEAISVLDKIKIGGTPIPKILTDFLKKIMDKFQSTTDGGGSST